MIALSREKHHRYQSVVMRIIFDVCVLLLAYTVTWWIALLCAMLLILFLRSYEMVLVGIILDILYTSGVTSPVGDFMFTSILLALITVSWFVSRHIRSAA